MLELKLRRVSIKESERLLQAIVLVILVPRVLDVEVPPVVPGGKVFVAVDVRTKKSQQ